MNKPELIEPFENALINPAEQVRQWKKENGSKVVGFLMTDVPEELAHAAGFFPYGIINGKADLEKADTHLQTWVCSHARSSLALALGNKLDFLDGLIIPQTCDTTRMLLDLWKQVQPLPYMDDFRLPRQVDRPSAKNYLVSELKRLRHGLEQFSGCTIDPESLKQSVNLYNQNRKLMRKIVDLHAQDPALISSREIYTIINGAMVMPREKVSELLDGIVKALEEQPYTEKDREPVRIFLSGTLLEPLEILDYIEEFGGTVIGDDFQNGYRYIESDVVLKDNLIEALAERQLNRIPSAAFDIEHKPRRIFLSNLAKEKKARGAILFHIKFCEPENFDSYDNLQAMQKNGIPAMRIETQFGRTGLGQLRTRIHAFMEMVGGGSK